MSIQWADLIRIVSILQKNLSTIKVKESLEPSFFDVGLKYIQTHVT